MKKIFLLTGLALTVFARSLKAQLSPDSVSIQLIHNSPDPAADTVDVWFFVPLTNTEYPVLPNFAYRTATPVISAIPGAPVGYIPAGLAFEVRVKPKGSTTSTSPVFTKSFPTGLPKGKYHIFAQGVFSQNLLDSIPGTAETFDIVGYPNAVFTSAPDSTTLRIVHGSPDAPGVRVFAGVTTFTFASVVDSLTFNESADATIKAKPLRFWISPQGTAASAAIAKFNGNAVGGLGGVPAAVFASGFLKTSIAPNLSSFGLFAALPNGTVVQLPAEISAGVVQIIHNSPDPTLASTVGAFVSGDKLPLQLNFRGGFQSASFIANFDYAIGLAPNNGNTPTVTFPSTQFAAGENRIIVVSGVVNPANFKVNPNGFSTALKLNFFSPAKYNSTTGNTEILVFHGAPDAPFVDVFAPGVSQTIVNNLGYGSYTPAYIGPLPGAILANQILQVKDSTGTTIVSNHVISSAQATAITGKAILAFASGFLDSSAANQNGRKFGLFVAIDNGGPTPTVVQLKDTSLISSISNPTIGDLEFRMYPNPASTEILMSFNVKEQANVTIEILDLNGRVVKNVANTVYNNEKVGIREDIRDLQSGLYFARVKSDAKTSSYKFNVVR